jgi:hypothetical protein
VTFGGRTLAIINHPVRDIISVLYHGGLNDTRKKLGRFERARAQIYFLHKFFFHPTPLFLLVEFGIFFQGVFVQYGLAPIR